MYISEIHTRWRSLGFVFTTNTYCQEFCVGGSGIGLQDEIKAPIGLIIDDHLRRLHGQLSYLCTDRFTVDRLTVGVTFGPGQGNEQDIWHRVHGEELDVHLRAVLWCGLTVMGRF